MMTTRKAAITTITATFALLASLALLAAFVFTGSTAAQGEADPTGYPTGTDFAPRQLMAQHDEATGTRLSWLTPADSRAPTGYRIYRRGSDDAAFTALATTSTQTSYQDAGSTGQSSYSYIVVADYPGDTGGASSRPVVYNMRVPFTPRNPAAAAGALSGSAVVTWTAPPEHSADDCAGTDHMVTSYDVMRRGPDETDFSMAMSKSAEGKALLSITDSDLDPGTYEYTVRAKSNLGSSLDSPIAQITLADYPAGLPQNFTADMVGPHIELNWDHPTEGRPRIYDFRWAPQGWGTQPFQQDLYIAGNYLTATYHSDSHGHVESIYRSGSVSGTTLVVPIERGIRYTFQIRSRSGDLTSDWVQAQVLNPTLAATKADMIAGITAARSGDKITVTWDAASDMSITHFTIRRAEVDSNGETTFTVNNRREARNSFIDVNPGTPSRLLLRLLRPRPQQPGSQHRQPRSPRLRARTRRPALRRQRPRRHHQSFHGGLPRTPAARQSGSR